MELGYWTFRRHETENPYQKTLQQPVRIVNPINGENVVCTSASNTALSWYLKTIGPDEKTWLSSVAPFVSLNHNTHRFIQNLQSLADRNPREVCEVLDKVFQANFPNYDYENRIEALLEKLWSCGLRSEVTLLIEKLRPSLPSVAQLFSRLSQ